MKPELSILFNSIAGWLTSNEGKFLEKAAKSVKSEEGVIVEIGSFCGKSTICLSQAGETVYAIDPHKGDFSGGKAKPTYNIFLENLSKAGVSDIVKPIVKTSREASKKWNKPIKLLFIDGLHDFDHVNEDVLLWSPHLVKGGIIAMHDAFCGWEGSSRVAIEQIVHNSKYGEIGVVGSIIYGVKKKASIRMNVTKVLRQYIIELNDRIYKLHFIPGQIRFIINHKILKLFLINRFTSFR